MKKEPWMRTCSECGKAMAQGYVVGGGDEYYCSDKCLHKHYSEEEWEEMTAPVPGESDPWEEDEEGGNDTNYWTEWGPGDELEESVNEVAVAEEYDPYDVASDLLESIFDHVAYSPEWWEDGYGAPDFDHNAEVEGWTETWENRIAAGIEKGIKSGRIKEDDDWNTFVRNIKNSEVGNILSKARKDLLKIFEKIEGGEKLDESRKLGEPDRSGLEEFVGDVIEDIMNDTARLAWPTEEDEPDPGYDWRNHPDVRHWAERWTERFIEDYEKNGTNRWKGEPVISDRLFNHASQELLDILDDVYPQHGIRR